MMPRKKQDYREKPIFIGAFARIGCSSRCGGQHEKATVFFYEKKPRRQSDEINCGTECGSQNPNATEQSNRSGPSRLQSAHLVATVASFGHGLSPRLCATQFLVCAFDVTVS